MPQNAYTFQETVVFPHFPQGSPFTNTIQSWGCVTSTECMDNWQDTIDAFTEIFCYWVNMPTFPTFLARLEVQIIHPSFRIMTQQHLSHMSRFPLHAQFRSSQSWHLHLLIDTVNSTALNVSHNKSMKFCLLSEFDKKFSFFDRRGMVGVNITFWPKTPFDRRFRVMSLVV